MAPASGRVADRQPTSTMPQAQLEAAPLCLHLSVLGERAIDTASSSSRAPWPRMYLGELPRYDSSARKFERSQEYAKWLIATLTDTRLTRPRIAVAGVIAARTIHSAAGIP
jgi:hypothetical protein